MTILRLVNYPALEHALTSKKWMGGIDANPTLVHDELTNQDMHVLPLGWQDVLNEIGIPFQEREIEVLIEDDPEQI